MLIFLKFVLLQKPKLYIRMIFIQLQLQIKQKDLNAPLAGKLEKHLAIEPIVL